MDKKLTFFESLFLNKELKDKKTTASAISSNDTSLISSIKKPKYSETTFNFDNNITLADMLDIRSYNSSFFFKNKLLGNAIDNDVDSHSSIHEDTEYINNDDENKLSEAETSEIESLDIAPSEIESFDIEPSEVENNGDLILLDNENENSLFEEDDEDRDTSGDTKVYMTSLSKTLKFNSNIDFDKEDPYDDIDNSTENSLSDIDLLDSIEDNEDDNFTEPSKDFFESESQDKNDKENFTLGDGVLHFDLDDQLNIEDLEGATNTHFNPNTEQTTKDFESSDFNSLDFEDGVSYDDDITTPVDDSESNFPTLGSIDNETVEESTVNDDDDEINIPML